MTRYHGGKANGGKEIAKFIAEIAEDIEDSTNFKFQGYWEPFCGMCGVYRHIPALLGDIEYVASDFQPSVIKMWQALQKGWTPPKNVSKEMHAKYKKSKKESAEKAYIGFGYSFGGMYFNSYIGDCGKTYTNKHNSIIKIAEKMEDVKFIHSDYRDIDVKNFIIYCDPPYSNSQCRYITDNGLEKFDNKSFWDWARRMSKNNLVIVSEYTSPKDFKAIGSRVIKQNNIASTKTQEYFFIHKDWVKFL